MSGPTEQFSVRSAIAKAKVRKAAGPSGVIAEMIKASEQYGVKWMTHICSSVVKVGVIPEDWKKSWLVNVYKGKGDLLTVIYTEE